MKTCTGNYMVNKKQRIILYVITGIGLGFIILTIFVWLVPGSVIDWEFSQEVQETQNPFLDSFMIAVSLPGNMPYSVITVLSVAAVFLVLRYKREALFIVLTMLSGLVSTLVKLLINRPRPSEPLVRVISKNLQQSFPSGHVMFYVIFFGFITLLMYQLKSIPRFVRILVAVISLVMIFLVSVSRIYLGAHWFTDVLGGFLLGIVCLYCLGYFYLKNKSIQ